MKNKKILISIIGIILIIFLIFIINRVKAINKNNEMMISNIKKHYSDNVITIKNTKLYKKENNKFIENGIINKGVTLSLKEVEIDENTLYFYIPSLESYIYFDDINQSYNENKDDRYKNYIYFNKNIKTKDITNFYDKEDNLLYTLNKSYDFKVLIMDNDRYGVAFNGDLLYIKKDDVESLYENNNNESNKEKIRTLYYHFIYNPEKDKCDQIICHTLNQFESHLKYLSENNYFTLKMEELEMYLNGKINIPEKSIVLTIDDGTFIDLDAVKLLEKYKKNATLFAITDWINIDDFNSPYLDLESHSNNMHNQYECKGMGTQGGGILCLPEEKVLKDLKTSQDLLGGSKYFSYPFFDYNDRAVNLLKKAGFSLGFIGPISGGYAYPNKTNKLLIPRLGIFSYTTIDEFISYLK